MTLARRYHLEGALAAILLLAGLFVWRNVVSLVPRGAPDAAGIGAADGVLGHSASAGYLNLLRRSVRPRDLPAVCLARWESSAVQPGGRRSAPVGASRSMERLRAVLAQEAALPARRRSPLAVVYRAMCAAARRQA